MNYYLYGALYNCFQSDEYILDSRYSNIDVLRSIKTDVEQYLINKQKIGKPIEIKYKSNIGFFVLDKYIDALREMIDSLDNIPLAYIDEFISGFIDINGGISVSPNDIRIHVHSHSIKTLQWIQKFTPHNILYENEKVLEYKFTNLIDLVGFLKHTRRKKEFNLYITGHSTLPLCRVYKRHPNAIIPSKVRLSDVGLDLSIISVYKKLDEFTTLYDTGIALKIPQRYYVEIVPRSSISKSGYILTNSVGIIDRSYRGNIYISLTKINPSAKPIEEQFPFRCCQMIFKIQEFVELQEEVDENEFTMTSRNHGGYGSTDITE